MFTSPLKVKESASKMAYVYQSSGCDSFALQPVGQITMKNKNVRYMPGAAPEVPKRCPDTNSGYIMGGPVWADPIHDFEFVQVSECT